MKEKKAYVSPVLLTTLVSTADVIATSGKLTWGEWNDIEDGFGTVFGGTKL